MADPVFKPFPEMKEEDYAAIGFKSGLEIHQQLLTGKKLFCRCPAGRYSDHFDAEILRHMRPTLSELGEYDGTALMEFKTRKEIIYQIHRETVCTYEMDDTPPFELNEEALDIALGIAMLYGCLMVDEIHIARKQYLDGSIPTGFQRTTIVGVDGKIPYKEREIRIVQLGLEEDACREVRDVGHERIYLTDRLGMPLVETVTAPDMRTPQEVAEVGEIFRRLVRSTGKVRTGIGAARQDVNVSVTGGTRIEIKGVPRLPHIPLLTYNEAMRQWNLLRLREELHRRKITPETFAFRTETVTRVLQKTRFLPVQNALREGMRVKAVALRGFKGLLRWQTQTGTFFSREISDRVRVIACLTTLPNLIHSDSPSETLSSSEWQSAKKAVGAGEDDTVVIVWGSPADAETGANEIIARAKDATIGVPSETRQALRDGTNGFERILPGPDRMYPDTDLPPKRITGQRLETLRTTLPQPVWIRENRYREMKVPDDVIRPLAISVFASLFETVVGRGKLPPSLVGVTLVQFPKRLRKKFGNGRTADDGMFRKVFQACEEGNLTRDGIYFILEKALQDGNFPDLSPRCSETELKKIVEQQKSMIEKMKFRDWKKKKEKLMGLVMSRIRGRIEGKKVESYLSTLTGDSK